jgi:hypothetical protein
MADHFVAGEVYFRVKYAEPMRRYPLIESFVFVGKNLSDDDSENTWYFQFADCFAKIGSILKGSGGDRRVCCLAASDLEDMFDSECLAVELEAAAHRRQTG